MPNHMAELGGNFAPEFTLSLLESENDALDQIEAAIERIEDGSYGQCEVCVGKMPKYRLEAIPYAALCVRCASRQERDPRLERQEAEAAETTPRYAWVWSETQSDWEQSMRTAISFWPHDNQVPRPR